MKHGLRGSSCSFINDVEKRLKNLMINVNTMFLFLQFYEVTLGVVHYSLVETSTLSADLTCTAEASELLCAHGCGHIWQDIFTTD